MLTTKLAGHLKLIYLITALIVSSCINDSSEELEKVMNLAGANRAEFQMVLDNFSNDPADSLKYRAACFLIKNMQGHRSDLQESEGDSLRLFYNELNERIYEFSKSGSTTTIQSSELLQAINTLKQKISAYLNQNRSAQFFIYDQKEDLRTIKGKDLIAHIEHRFKVWKKSKWSSSLSFQEFQETLLPYRSRNEPIHFASNITGQGLTQFLLDSDNQPLDSLVHRFNKYAFLFSCIPKDSSDAIELGQYNILKLEKVDCGIHSEWTRQIFGAAGIPMAYDFTPSWKNRDRHHFWLAVRDIDGRYRPFNPIYQDLNDSIYFSETSKVYRITYSAQRNPMTMKRETEEVPDIFQNKFISDVSEQYHEVKDISIPAPKNNVNLAYLAIFSASGWKPVAWGKIDKVNKLVRFRKVPVNTVYVVGYFENGKVNVFKDPFILHKNGQVKEIVPKETKRSSIILTRKFHEKGHLIEMLENMVGLTVQASSSKDFKSYDTIHMFSYSDLWPIKNKKISISQKKKYRYLRILGNEKQSVNLAAFEIYGINGQIPYSINLGISSTSLSPTDSTECQKNKNNYKKLVDSNPETFMSTKILILDMKRLVTIDSIKFMARNSNNGISIGNKYELFYYNRGWRSAGKSIAKNESIVYKNIPQNTIYWLRNLTNGKEEQAFFYRNGSQIFINEDNYIKKTWIPFHKLIF